ncbi:P-loop containing nucleoside triphosphate hydrolase protein [Coniochaeta sp. 2T2.1]|nr:P-loop containing nucleoside triphosphate hydrolase protein [Coniochaeta sp. 2T2.1]
MPPKRKAPAPKGSSKAGRASALSTPGPATPRSLDDSDEGMLRDEDWDDDPSALTEHDIAFKTSADKLIGTFDIESDAYQHNQKYHDVDSASSYFGNGRRDYSWLRLRPDHDTEPRSRPVHLHEYQLTSHSLYAAVSVGLLPQDIINALDRFLKTPLPDVVSNFILRATENFGKVKLVLKANKYYVESPDEQVLQKLLKDPVIGGLRVNTGSNAVATSIAPTMGTLVIPGTNNAAGVQQATAPQPDEKADGEGGQPTEDEVVAAINEEDDDEDQTQIFSFEVQGGSVELVQKQCLDLGYPVLEEYDFRNDRFSTDLQIDLRPNTQIRPYQEKSLSKMFGNGRAKSGIIVLPCGAGKTLVGITAACTIKKGVLVLCTSSMSVHQWRSEFLKWSNISEDDICVFTSGMKKRFRGETGVIVTTYSMLNQANGKRAHDTQQMLDFIGKREWGLMLLDEVHVAPASVFRRVISSVKSHTKLGLTATLLREDDKISHLNFLVGPKLYEANWMELSQQGHIAKVQCAEVWCPMPSEFYDEYLKERTNSDDEKKGAATLKRTLSAMNPSKFQSCQYLINYHESRGDKIIVFSDELYALKAYSEKLHKFCIYGATAENERMSILSNFQFNPNVNTLFLSKIGDTSLDLPEATVLIQISSHFGSRRQEAQRLGRILRAKRRNDEGFNAFFYSLVSKDTQEMFYSSKRQAFLVDQGYAFKVITHLQDIEKTPDLAFANPADRRELLQKILSDSAKGDIDRPDTSDDLHASYGGAAAAARRKAGVRRTAGTLGELSGGKDMAYVEQSKPVKQTKKAQKAAQNPWFAKQERELERARKKAREEAGAR